MSLSVWKNGMKLIFIIKSLKKIRMENLLFYMMGHLMQMDQFILVMHLIRF